jgi:hypothetical protein
MKMVREFVVIFCIFTFKNMSSCRKSELDGRAPTVPWHAASNDAMFLRLQE